MPGTPLVRERGRQFNPDRQHRTNEARGLRLTGTSVRVSAALQREPPVQAVGGTKGRLSDLSGKSY
jgi:hypothetical protein